jgi:alpha-1,4-digalacturonate transport system permease protein
MSEMSPVAPAGRAQDNGALARLTQIALLPVGVVLRLLDPPMRALQRVIGARNMAYVFLLPNFVFFGLFVFLPIGINVVFSVTGGTALFPSQRPYVGSDQFAYLFDCGSYFDPSSCREDHFWRGVANTAKFVVFQVAAMVLFSLITALVLNLKIRGRGFFRAV